MPLSVRMGRRFWTIFVASTISNLGSGITYVAMPLLAASYTRDARLVAAVSIASYLPALLLGLHSGALVDRRDRRSIMWRTDVVRAILVSILAVLVALDRSGIWVLIIVALLLGATTILFENAASTIIPMLVDRPVLERANALLMSGQSIAGQFVGLPVGGLLFGIGAAVPFGVDAVTFAVAVGLVLSVPGRYVADRGSGPATTVWQDIREGAVWLWRHRLLRTLAMLVGVVNAATGAGEAILVLYALEELDVGQLGYSLLLALFAVGAVGGGLVASRLRRSFGGARSIHIAVLIMIAALIVPGLTTSLAAVCVALVAIGAAGMVWNVITVSLRQAAVPPHLLGRVTSAYRVVGIGALPLGAALGGLVAHSAGLHAPWLVAAVLLTLAAAAALPFIRQADFEAAARAAAAD